MRELWRRLRALVLRWRMDRELEEELRFHHEMKARDTGNPEAATAALGNPLRIRERARDAWGWTWLDDIAGDVRYALRQWARSPLFTVTCVVTLAVGIGVNAAVFAVAESTLFNGFPNVDPDNRLVYVTTPRGVSYPDFEDWRDRSQSLSAMAVIASGGLRYHLRQESGAASMVDATRLSTNAFDVLEQRPLLGRTFSPADQVPGAPAVALLNYRLWEQVFAGDAAVIGRTVTLNGVPTTVVGVMPRGLNFPHYRVDVWLPLDGVSLSAPRDSRTLWYAVGRLRPGVEVEAARADLERIGATLASAYPDTNHDLRPSVDRYRESSYGRDAVAFYGAMWAAAALVLLVACADIAGLLVARSNARARELTVRVALGAGRWRVARQLLIENLVLSAGGGLAGCAVAAAGLAAYRSLGTAPGSYARWELALNWHVLAYLAASTMISGLLFGLVPARGAWRLDAMATLKAGGRTGSDGPAGRRLAGAMVTVEMALALAVLAMASVMVRSVVNATSSDIGVRAEGVLTASVAFPRDTAEDTTGAIGSIRDRLAALPGVESVAMTSAVPTYPAKPTEYEVAHGRRSGDGTVPAISSLVVSDGYFATLGVPVLSGRDFDVTDSARSAPVAIVNSRFAQLVWPDVDPIGQRLRLRDATGDAEWRVVVGVVGNVVQNQPFRGTAALRQNQPSRGAAALRFDPLVYLPLWQERVTYAALLARTSVPPENLRKPFEHVLLAERADVVVGSGFGPGTGPAPLSEGLAFQYWTKGFNGGLFSLFALIALVLSALGLYAVMAESVAMRHKELGIRTALGASARDVLGLVAMQSMRSVLFGLVLGLAAALALVPMLRSQLVDVSPNDPVSLATAVAILVAAAVAGGWLPARRAMQLDPVTALRHD